MDDLISRQAAIDALIELSIQRDEWDNEEGFAQKRGFNASICAIEDLPSAERRGRWIHRPVEEWGASNCKCSVCGTENFFPLLLKGGADNYCGNCGARMDGGENG